MQLTLIYKYGIRMILIYLLCCLLPDTALTARIGTDYKISIESMDNGGTAVSADYSANSAIGGSGGIAVGVDPIIKHGYIGQLYEIKSVNLSATPNTVNEVETRQISAMAALDDESILVLQDSDPDWSINGWPLASVSSEGIVTAAAVYESTSGTVSAVYNTCSGLLSLVVLDVDTDNYGSYAGDDLEDGWQVYHFGIDNPDAAPWKDPDSDGQSNSYEWVVGTDPTTNTSRFNMWIETVSGVSTQIDIVFNPAFVDRDYIVQKRSDLMSGSWTDMAIFAESTNGTERTMRDLNATDKSAFYRVQVNFNP